MSSRIALIVAMDREGVIGLEGSLPWHLPADLAHFKRTTLGKPVIMGRKTHESIGRPLPGRTNIVLTRSPGYVATGCITVHDVEQALRAAREASSRQASSEIEVMVIGGAEVYRLFLPHADLIYLTRVEGSFEGDARFPDLADAEWTESHREHRPADEANPHPLTFVTLQRS